MLLLETLARSAGSEPYPTEVPQHRPGLTRHMAGSDGVAITTVASSDSIGAAFSGWALKAFGRIQRRPGEEASVAVLIVPSTPALHAAENAMNPAKNRQSAAVRLARPVGKSQPHPIHRSGCLPTSAWEWQESPVMCRKVILQIACAFVRLRRRSSEIAFQNTWTCRFFFKAHRLCQPSSGRARTSHTYSGGSQVVIAVA